MDIATLVIQAVSGAIGGNAASAVAKPASLGVAGNSLVGGIGGVIIGQILPLVLSSGALPAGLDATAIATGFATGGIGGAVTALVIGLIKAKFAKA